MCMADDRFISIGKIASPVGLRGYVKLYPYTDRIDHYNTAEVFIEGSRRSIEIIRYVKRTPILKIEGVSDRQQAERLNGAEIAVLESELSDLPEGAYYLKDLIGCSVIDETNDDLGFISNVMQNSAQDIYEITGKNGKSFMIPAVAEFILDVDIDSKIVKVHVPAGLRDL